MSLDECEKCKYVRYGENLQYTEPQNDGVDDHLVQSCKFGYIHQEFADRPCGRFRVKEW
jgi:hypothetical protein